jgi:hypothetical protein
MEQLLQLAAVTVGSCLNLHFNSNISARRQDHDLDIWQVTPSAVDIYSPSSSPLPTLLQNLPHNATKISTGDMYSNRKSVSHTGEWNLPSLENSTYHSSYHPLYEIDAFIHELAALHPNLTHVDYLGHSGERREMLSLTISRKETSLVGFSKGRQKRGGKKLGFVITGAQHAREVRVLQNIFTFLRNKLFVIVDCYGYFFVPCPCTCCQCV